MRLTDDEIAAIAMREVTQAQGYESDVLASKRALVLALYEGSQPVAPQVNGQAVEGRSSVVSMDVADSLHALLAQTAPVLKSSLIEFPPDGEADVVPAQTESDVVRRVLERSDAYGCLNGATHDALLIGNGWLHLRLEDYTYTQRQRVSADVPPEALASLPDDTVLERDGDALVLTRTTTRKQLVIESVPPEEMLFSNEPGVEDLQRLRLVARRRTYTQAALLDMGIDRELVEAVPDAVVDYPAEQARQGMYKDQYSESVQDATRLKTVYCCYLRLDLDDAGRETELREVWIGRTGGALLLNEPAEFIPYVTGSPCPVPHRIQGRGIGELVASIQASKTQTLRDYLDNLGVMNASRVGALDGEVNMGDLTNGRLNGVVRMRRPDAVFPLPSADIGPQALQGLEYLDRVRAQRVGAALDQTEVQAQLMTASATAAAGQLAQAEMMAGWFAGNLANTLLKQTYLLAHRMLRSMDQPLMAQQGGQWVQVMPRDWQERTIAQVTMGLTTAQRTQRQMALQMVVNQQVAMMQQGLSGQLTDTGRLYNAMCDWLRAADLQDPDQYLINPASPQAQQAAQAAMQQQQQQQAQMQQLQEALIRMQQDFELEKQRRDLEYKAWSDRLKAETEGAKIEGDATIEAIKIRDARIARDDERREAARREREGLRDGEEQAA